MNTEQNQERESRMWWVYDCDSNTFIETMGHSCAPNWPEHWFFPLLQISVCEGHWCFKTREEAIAAEIRKSEEALETVQRRLAELKAMSAGMDVAWYNRVALAECNGDEKEAQ